MRVSSWVSNGVAYVGLEGDLDLASALDVDLTLRELERQEPRVIQLDLRDVSFLDSSGVRLILEADTRARETDRRLVLVRGPESVDRVFRITLLDRRLEFVDEPIPSEGSKQTKG